MRASALQADLPKLRDGVPARIVGADPSDALRLPATVVLGPLMHPAHARALKRAARALRNVAMQVSILQRYEHLKNIPDFDLDEVWREAKDGALARRGRDAFLSRVIEYCQTLVGCMAGSMSRDAAYHFLRAGRYLERADMTSRIVDVGTANVFPWRQGQGQVQSQGQAQRQGGRDDGAEESPYEAILWMSVLRSLVTLAYDCRRGDMFRVQLFDMLRLIERAIRSCREAGVPVSLCGQMSGSKTYTMLLLGMGMRLLSATPSVIPELKLICRSVTIAQCEEVTERVMQMENARNIKLYLRQRLKSLVPDVVRDGV